MLRRSTIAAALLALTPACRKEAPERKAPRHAEPAAAASAAVDSAPGPPAKAKFARCGYGPVDRASRGDVPPWLVVLADVEAARPVAGVRILAAELYASDVAVARAAGDPSIRVQTGAPGYSYGAAGTAEIGAELPQGNHRLRIATRLDAGLAAIREKKPARCRVVLTDENGDNMVITGELDPAWTME